MKNLIMCLLAALLGLLPAKAEKEFVNLTPRPKNILTYDGRVIKSFYYAMRNLVIFVTDI